MKYDQKRYLLCCLKVGIKDISLQIQEELQVGQT